MRAYEPSAMPKPPTRLEDVHIWKTPRHDACCRARPTHLKGAPKPSVDAETVSKRWRQDAKAIAAAQDAALITVRTYGALLTPLTSFPYTFSRPMSRRQHVKLPQSREQLNTTAKRQHLRPICSFYFHQRLWLKRLASQAT